jgi:molybdate transport system substrate-binding protein
MRRLLNLALATVIAATAFGATAQTDVQLKVHTVGPVAIPEIKVMCAGAVEGALRKLAEDYSDSSYGDSKVVPFSFVFGNVGMIQDRLKAGEPTDVAILSAASIDALGKAGELTAGGGVPLGRVGMGVAVKAGAPTPDIATPDAFKATLLAAKSIAYSDPAGGGSSGVYFDSLIQRLGIGDAIRKKAVLIRGGSAADRVVSGEAAMAVQNESELIHVPGVQLVGPFPAEDQNYLAYAAGVSVRSPAPQRALAFIRYLTRPEAAERWKSAGIEPAAGK